MRDPLLPILAFLLAGTLGCGQKVSICLRREAPRPAVSTPAPFKAGAAIADITPGAGYDVACSGKPSLGAWSRLYARAIYLEQTDVPCNRVRRIALVSCDIQVIPPLLTEQVAHLLEGEGFERSDIAIAATGNDHGPDVKAFDHRLFMRTAALIRNCVLEAKAGAADASVSLGYGRLAFETDRSSTTQPTKLPHPVLWNTSFLSFMRNSNAFAVMDDNADLRTLYVDRVESTDGLGKYWAVYPRLAVLCLRRTGDGSNIALAAFAPFRDSGRLNDLNVWAPSVFGLAAAEAERILSAPARRWTASTSVPCRPMPVVAVFAAPAADVAIAPCDLQGLAAMRQTAHTVAREILARAKSEPAESITVIDLRADAIGSSNPNRPPCRAAIYRIGPALIAALPGDATTAYTWRMRQQLQAQVKGRAVVLMGLCGPSFGVFKTTQEDQLGSPMGDAVLDTVSSLTRSLTENQPARDLKHHEIRFAAERDVGSQPTAPETRANEMAGHWLQGRWELGEFAYDIDRESRELLPLQPPAAVWRSSTSPHLGWEIVAESSSAFAPASDELLTLRVKARRRSDRWKTFWLAPDSADDATDAQYRIAITPSVVSELFYLKSNCAHPSHDHSHTGGAP